MSWIMLPGVSTPRDALCQMLQDILCDLWSFRGKVRATSSHNSFSKSKAADEVYVFDDQGQSCRKGRMQKAAEAA